jgi:Uma2 family endonuclease
MSSAQRNTRKSPRMGLPVLANGDRLRQAEFHRLYESHPDETKFELIGGTVFMASPLRWAHGRSHSLLAWFLENYTADTLGTEVLDNATTILDDDNEPQPDLSLRLLPEYGGKSLVNADGYLVGIPELIVEIALSTRAIDLHQKKDAYRRGGAQEYLVLSLEQKELAWFDFRARRKIDPDTAGVYKSRAFPGLWLHVPALLAQRKSDLLKCLRTGLQSAEHSTFVKRLQGRQRRRS